MEEKLFPVVEPVKEKGGEMEIEKQKRVESKENQRRKTSSEQSVRELGVVIEHDGSVESVGRLAGAKLDWWLAGLDLRSLGVLDS